MPNNIAADRTSLMVLIAAATIALLGGCTNGGDNSGTPAAKKEGAKESTTESGAPSGPATIKVVKVESHRLHSELDLPGNLEAFLDVPLHAKVEGYISWIGVDRGSVVHKGEHLISITAPEVDSKVNEALSKLSAADADYKRSLENLQGIRSKRVEVRAKMEADQLTLQRLQEANKTPGAIAQNDVDMAQKAVEGDQARVDSLQSEVAAGKKLVEAQNNNVQAARQVVDSMKAMHAYLDIVAPFDGVVTERNVHQGSIVAVDSSRISGTPMLRLQQKSVLRLVVAVPESSVSGIKIGERIPFTVPAFVGKIFYGTIARPAYALDTKTRTMPVELDVPNADGELEPGMFATVKWVLTRPYDTLFLPASAVASDLRGTFVERIQDGTAQRVSVRQGQPMGKQLEIVGNLAAGQDVALKATDEIKNGTHLVAQAASEKDVEAAGKHASAGGE